MRNIYYCGAPAWQNPATQIATEDERHFSIKLGFPETDISFGRVAAMAAEAKRARRADKRLANRSATP